MRLVVLIMGQDCEDTIGMVLESVKNADSIIYLDGGSTDKTRELTLEFFENNKQIKPAIILMNEYDQQDPTMNGKQRNFYLDYLKKNHMNDWCLVLDADEVLEDLGIEKIKQTISQLTEPVILSPRIHHFIGDLGHEDATHDIHYVPNRLFQITEDLIYPGAEHPVLQGSAKQGVVDIHIYHLRECLGIFSTRIKHLNNWGKSKMHTKDYLNWWNVSMLMGTYPTKPIYYGQLPSPIKQHFYLFKDA